MESLSVAVPIASGFVSIAIGLYGALRVWQDKQRERAAALRELAAVSVRVTEATYVRPILRARLNDIVQSEQSGTADALFATLQARLGLTCEEKVVARTLAFNHLVDELRAATVVVPLDVSTDDRLRRHEVVLRRELEIAYTARPRPTGQLIAEMVRFTGRSSPPAAQAAADPPRAPSA